VNSYKEVDPAFASELLEEVALAEGERVELALADAPSIRDIH